jgi:hypothetical protein
MRKLLAAAIVLALLAGCANNTLQQRIAYLNQFVGVSEQDLVRVLGVPTRSFETGGHLFLAYVDRRIDIIPGPPVWGPWGFNNFYPGAFPSQVIEQSCETTFDLVDGRVQSFTLRGNAC